MAADETLKEYAEDYTRQLEASSGKFQHIIWPEHCLIGSPGHCVVPPVLTGTCVRGCVTRVIEMLNSEANNGRRADHPPFGS